MFLHDFTVTNPHPSLIYMKLVLRNSLKGHSTKDVVLSVFVNIFLVTNYGNFWGGYFLIGTLMHTLIDLPHLFAPYNQTQYVF